MHNVGEEICGEYLRVVQGCEFLSYNVINPDTQGEMDVVGLNLKKHTIFLCEVATHTGGLQYVKKDGSGPEDFKRFYKKFEKNISYAKKYFPTFENYRPMLWSPVVNVATEKAKYNTYTELVRLQEALRTDFDVDLELVVNEDYLDRLNQLRAHAGKETSRQISSVLRFLQIEEKLERHIERLKKRGIAA